MGGDMGIKAPGIAKIQTRRVLLSSLKPADYNPRTISEQARKALEASIRKFGLVQPIVWNSRTGNVVSGHQRLSVLQAAGEVETDVVVVDLDDIDEKALNITQNNPHIAGEFDEEKLQPLLVELEEMDFVLEPLRLDELMDGGDTSECEDPPPMDPPDDPVTQPGDLWILGDHRLVCGDSTDEATVARLMDGAKADMVFTDPPYGVEYVGKTADALTIQNDTEDGILALCEAFMARLMEATKQGACWYVCTTPAAVGLNFANAMVALGAFHQQLVWNKNSLTMGLADYQPKHELMLYGWTPGAAHKKLTDRTQPTVWDIDRPSRSADHPTMKPVELVLRAINNSSDRGEIVLDLFGGSGTTLLAAEQAGRKARLVELSPAYCDVIVRRWEEMTGKKAVREAAS